MKYIMISSYKRSVAESATIVKTIFENFSINFYEI